MILMSVDPGTTNCGIVISTKVEDIVVVHHTELIIAKTSYKSALEVLYMGLYGGRFLKILRIIERMKELITEFSVTEIAIEGNYYNPTMPAAYAALVEFVFAVKKMVAMPLSMVVHIFSPMDVKKVMTVSHKLSKEDSRKKTFMTIALKERKENGSIIIDKDIDEMSEHEIDATAIGYTCHFLLEKLAKPRNAN